MGEVGFWGAFGGEVVAVAGLRVLEAVDGGVGEVGEVAVDGLEDAHVHGAADVEGEAALGVVALEAGALCPPTAHTTLLKPLLRHLPLKPIPPLPNPSQLAQPLDTHHMGPTLPSPHPLNHALLPIRTQHTPHLPPPPPTPLTRPLVPLKTLPVTPTMHRYPTPLTESQFATR